MNVNECNYFHIEEFKYTPLYALSCQTSFCQNVPSAVICHMTTNSKDIGRKVQSLCHAVDIKTSGAMGQRNKIGATLL